MAENKEANSGVVIIYGCAYCTEDFYALELAQSHVRDSHKELPVRVVRIIRCQKTR